MTNTTIDQPRDDVGRFGEKRHGAPEVSLAAATNDEFSFKYPPRTFASAQEYVDFWMSTPVPEGVLDNLLSAYNTRRDYKLNDRLDEWAEQYDNDPNNVRYAHEDWRGFQRRRGEARQAVVKEFEADWPTQIPSQVAREVARAGQIMTMGTFMPKADRDAAAETAMVHYEQFGGVTFTAKDLWSRYHLEEFFPEVVNDPSYAQRIMNNLTNARLDAIADLLAHQP